MNIEPVIKDYFSEQLEGFTIYVVEQKFALNRGREYFNQFISNEHFINSNNKIEKHLKKILRGIQKKIPDVAELTKSVLSTKTEPSPSGMVDVVISLSKLFTITQHQAVGSKEIAPIIVEEINISSNYIAQLVSLYKESIIRPVIIIILKDDNFQRAKELLVKCPHNTNVKFIRNNGDTKICKIINTGVDNITDFIAAFSTQCFSTCSKTNRQILLNSEFEEKNLINQLSPHFFKIRTNLLYDEKPEAITDINYVINRVSMARTTSNNTILLNSLELMAKLNRIYCNDAGSTDIKDILTLSKELDIELLKAHVYRFAQFIPDITRDRQKELLQEARNIFQENNVADHAIYCQNNFLVHSFYTNRINTRQFLELQQQALTDVPGLIGMSIILNNAGVAYLYNRDFSNAIFFLKKGLDYAKERIVQKIGIQSNLLIAKACSYTKIEENEIRILFEMVLANFSKDYLSFIAANYIINLLVMALEQHYTLGKEIFNNTKVRSIISSALTNNILGSGSLTQQLIVVQSRFPEIDFSIFPMPREISPISGIRAEFILEKGYNPAIFNAWL